jgi:hypothetical protein
LKTEMHARVLELVDGADSKSAGESRGGSSPSSGTMYIDIYEYIKRSKIDRQSHLILDDPCICIGGCSTNFKALLAHSLKTTIPSGKKILLCHACHNGKCSNVKHLYWGTPKENIDDARIVGSQKNIWENMVKKYGEQEARKMQKRIGADYSHMAKLGNKGKLKAQIQKQKISASLKKYYSGNMTTRINQGRKPINDTIALVELVNNVGYDNAALSLGISKESLKARYYRAKYRSVNKVLPK